MSVAASAQAEQPRYVRAPRPLVFPSHAESSETSRHLELRTLLYRSLKRELASRASVGSLQFVYWDASDPSQWLAPAVFVRLGVPDTDFDSWMTWRRGAPHLAVEMSDPRRVWVPDSDPAPPNEWDGAAWQEKLARYHALGVLELVRFCADDPPGRMLRVWDRVADDFVERVVADDRTPCMPLGLHWVVAPGEGFAYALRLARDEAGTTLLPSDAELLEAARSAALEREPDRE